MLRMERLFSSPLNSRDAPRRKNGAAKIRSVTLQEQQGENEHAFSHGHYWKSWGATARHLLKQGKQARALVRNREKAAKWADQGVELVEGDWNDATAIAAALKGVEGAFVMLPAVWAPSPDYREAKGVIAKLCRGADQGSAPAGGSALVDGRE
jgi:hypothetical protein